MFELTNEQRKCFGLTPVLDFWNKVEVNSKSLDNISTYAYLDGKRIVKVIELCENQENLKYYEFAVDLMLSDDGTKILPKSAKGKPKNFTAANLSSGRRLGMGFYYEKGHLSIINSTTTQCYYNSLFTSPNLENYSDLACFIEDWCSNTGEKELFEIEEFSRRKKRHQKIQEGDFFRYRIDRNLYGYGRILVDYTKMRRDGVPFWDVFMGHPLCVGVYHIVTDAPFVDTGELVKLKMLPSQMIMDNIFYCGECDILGNIPISSDEDNYTVHYGKSISVSDSKRVCYQCGKTFADTYSKECLYDGFINNGIGLNLNVKLSVLLECIENDSNDPYWSMMPQHCFFNDLRHPKFKEMLDSIRKQMGV